MAGYTPARTDNANVRDHTWLASLSDLEYAQSATGHVASLTAAGSHKLQNWLRGGTPVGIVTAAGVTKGQFGLYDPAATDGRQNHVGFVVDAIQLVDPVTGVTNNPITFAVIRRGDIHVPRLPVAFDPTAAGVDKSHFVYR